ncbi:hypothetical protein GW17_00016919 [Ensete ventricosum]|nr:hypothetical protein GW17_00016919 [Ensete ventricosum]
MAEVVDAPAETLDRGRDRQPELRESPGDGSSSPPPPPPRRRDRDLRERRDNWPPSRRDDPHDPRNRSPPLPPPPPPPPGPPRDDKDREYRRRSSPSPPTYRDRRHSPPRWSPPPGPFMRSRRDDGGYDRRRGSREVVMDRMTEVQSTSPRRSKLILKLIKKSNDCAVIFSAAYVISGPGVTVSSASKSGNGSELNSEDEADTNGKRRRHNKGPTKENDLLSAAPKAHPVSEPRRRHRPWSVNLTWRRHGARERRSRCKATDSRAMGLAAPWYRRGGTSVESLIPCSHRGRALVVKGAKEVENAKANSKYQDRVEGQRPRNFIRPVSMSFSSR